MEILLDKIALYWTRRIWPILQFAIGLGLIVFVHELGHFLVAKWSGIKVERFSLGFGKKLLGFRRGETEYRVGLLPLGGYVQMLGQDDFKPAKAEQADPRSWQAAKASKKLMVLSAGVVMNVILAAVVFVIVYLIGIRFLAPVVGGTEPGFPAATVVLPEQAARAMGVDKAVGLRPGDRVVAIDGEPIRKFRELATAAMTSDKGETFRLTVERQIGEENIRFDVMLEPKRDEESPDKLYLFGISPGWLIVEPGKHQYGGQQRFQPGDLLGEVAGEPIIITGKLPTTVRLTGEPVAITAARGGQRVPVPALPYLYSKSEDMLVILGMSARVEVAGTVPGSSAAAAGLKPGDVIVEYAGVKHPSRTQLRQANKSLLRVETPIRLKRGDQIVQAKVTPYREAAENVMGVQILPAQRETVVAAVAEDSPAAKAGIAPGAVITAVNDTPVRTWFDVYYALKAAGEADVNLAYTLDGAQRVARIGKLSKEQFDPNTPKKFEVQFPAIGQVEPCQTPLYRGGPIRAVVWGVSDTGEFIAMAYQSLAGILNRRVSHESARGPVGIGALAVGLARESTIHFVYFIAILSAIIAVFNFLPLPVLDGGHVVLVLIEKVRGRPLPTKVQAAIQYAGLVLILGIFLAVTFQDIVRLITS